MHGNGFKFSAPRYRESGRSFHSDADHPRSSRSEQAGQDPQVHCTPYFASGAKAAWPTAPSVRLQDTREVSGTMKFHPSIQKAFWSEAFSAPSRPGQHRTAGGDREGGFQANDYPPTSSVVFEGNKPAVVCGDYAQDKPSVQHDDKSGRERRAEGSHRPEAGGINRPRTEKKIAAATGTPGCEYAGCNRTPQYGVKEGVLSFCQDHKRKGMYTVRKGVLLVATRDGGAFRQTVSGPAVKSDNAATAAEVTSRKKCGNPSCDVQPSYGTAGTCRPGFCTRHKDKSHASLTARPCLFPGCDTRPHYDLSGGRAVFCVAHKKEGMAHILNGTNNVKEAAINRTRGEARAAEGKGRSAGNPTHEADEEGDREERPGKRQNGKESAGGGKGSSAQNAAVVGKKGNEVNKRRKTATRTLSRAAGLCSPCRTADGLGLAPSGEIKLLLEARESTRAAGEASVTGRRPRVPSRKFLEASGRVTDEGVQWMTKEKREEQARKKRELKEQKKAAAAAGLQVGQVLETTAVRLLRGANTVPRGNPSGGALGGGDAAAPKVFWRKLTPAETLRIAKEQPAIDGAQLDCPVDNTNAADATSAVAASKGKQERRAPVSAAEAAAETENRLEKQKYIASAGGPAAQQGSTVVEMAYESRPKRSKKDHDEREGGRERCAPKASCEFESCTKKASFGVNGVVRYCKMHRIFGMHKIVGRM